MAGSLSKSVPGKCKGPEAGVGVECLRHKERASVTDGG